MNTPAAKPNPESDHKGIASDLTVTLKGRIESWNKITPTQGDDFIQTVIVVPAKDAYSHPLSFAVNSDAKLGNDGADVSVVCQIRGYSRRRDGVKYHNINLWATN